MRIASLLVTASLTASAVSTVHADPRADYIFEIKEAGQEATRAWAVDKYVTFKLGPKCMAKLSDKKNGAIAMGLSFASAIVKYAKELTGDDWSHIESQNNKAEQNRKLVEPMMDAFGKRFAMTVAVEGDDCDASRTAPWLKYWSSVAYALEKYPPKADKVTVSLDVVAKAKEMTIDTGKDGATFKITAPRDIEPVWSDKLENAFKKVAREKSSLK